MRLQEPVIEKVSFAEFLASMDAYIENQNSEMPACSPQIMGDYEYAEEKKESLFGKIKSFFGK